MMNKRKPFMVLNQTKIIGLQKTSVSTTTEPTFQTCQEALVKEKINTDVSLLCDKLEL